MNEEFNPLDDSSIDYLVDGELDDNARRKFLLRAEETTGAWRQIALAYVEAQQWKSGITQLLANPTVQPAVQLKEPIKVNSSSYLIQAIAAVVLLSLIAILGYHVGNTNSEQQFITLQKNNLQPIITIENNQTNKLQPKLISNSFQQETTILRFEHPETGDITEQEFIVIDPDNPPPQFENWIARYEGELEISSEFLEDMGKHVTPKVNDKFYSLTLEDGRQAIIPISSRLVDQIEENDIEFQ